MGMKILNGNFHLSVGMKSLGASKKFYRDVLGAEIMYEGDYKNMNLYGKQITLKNNTNINVDRPNSHFGINLSFDEFEKLEKR